MKKIIQRLFGIDWLIKEQKKTNMWLERIATQSKRNADLQQAYNKSHNIR